MNSPAFGSSAKKSRTFFHKTKQAIGLAVCPCLFFTAFFPGLSLDSWMESKRYQEMSAQILLLVNREREKRSLPPLGSSRVLSVLACAHAREMAGWSRLTHISPVSGLTPLERIGYSFPNMRYFGENVAKARTVEILHDILMDSMEHRENILRCEFTKIGIGLAVDRDGVLYLAQDFIGQNPGETKPGPREPYFKADPDKVHLIVRLRFPFGETSLAEVTSEIGQYTVPASEDEKLVKQGIELVEKGKLDRAMENFLRVLDRNPLDRDARYNLALTMQKKGQFDEALKIFTALYEQDPGDVESLYSIGRHYYVHMDFEKAGSIFNRLIWEASEEDHPLLLIYTREGLARIAELRGNTAEAQKQYREIIRLGEEKGLNHPIIKRARRKIKNP